MLRAIAKTIKILNSETDPNQIALAVCFGLIAGLTPMTSPHNLLVLLAVLVLRVNLSTFILSTAVLSALAYVLDPLFHLLGLGLLTASPLQGLWTALYNTSWFRLARLNNTIVLGSLVFAALAFLPCLFLVRQVVVRYREHVLTWVRKSRIMQALTASRFYSVYQSVSGWRR